MRLVFGAHKNLDLLSRGGFASSSVVHNHAKAFQQQQAPNFLARNLRKKVSVAETSVRVVA